MSKHWRPNRDGVRSGFRGAHEQRRLLPHRVVPTAIVPLAIMVAGAAAIGVATLARWSSADSASESAGPSAPIEWNAVQAVPKAELSAEDMEWQVRASVDRQTPRSTSSGRASGVRVAFSACKWGGGTNCVVDGDTLYLAGAKIRIAGIDAPETHDYRCPSELALGEQAAARLQDLVGSGAITLTSIDRDRDRYGRLLRNVAVDGRDVGEVLVEEGLARPYAGGRRPWC